MGTFYRFADVTTHPNDMFDTTFSEIFSDLFDGQSTSSVIHGGTDTTGYFADFPIAKPPPFGEATLVGLEQYIYIGTLERDPPNAGNATKYKVYKSNRNIGDNEGKITPDLTSGTSKNDTLTVFSGSMHSENNTNFYENFSGSGGVSSQMISSTMWLFYDNPYITLADAAEVRGDHYVDSYTLREYWSDIHPTTGEEIIWLRRLEGNEQRAKTRVGGFFAWIAGDYPTLWTPMNASSYHLMAPAWYNEDIVDKMVWKQRSSSISDIEPYVNTATSAFNKIIRHHSGEMTDEGGKGIDSGIALSAQNSIDGGTSAKLYNYWHKGLVDQHSDEKWGIFNCYQRQEVVGVVPMMAPTHFDFSDSAEYNGWQHKGHYDSHWNNVSYGDGATGSEIEIKFNIEHLAKCVNSSADGDWGNMLTDQAMGRAFAITFSDIAPTETQSFYDFVHNFPDAISPTGHNHMAGLAFLKVNKDISSWEAGREDQTAWTDDGVVQGYIPRNPDGSRKKFGGIGSLIALPTTTRSPIEGPDAGWKTWDDISAITHNEEGEADIDYSQATELIQMNMVLPHFGKTMTGTLGCPIAEGEWISAKFKFSPIRGYVSCEMSYISSGEIFYRDLLMITGGDALRPIPWSLQHMSFWLINYPGDPSSNNDHPSTTEFDATETTENSVYIDSITYKNWNLKHRNMTANPNNRATRGGFTIGTGVNDDFFFEQLDITPTYLAIGFESRDDFDIGIVAGPSSDGTNLLFSDYSVSDSNNNAAIGNSSGHQYWRCGVTTNSNEEWLGNMFESNAYNDYSRFFDNYGNHSTLDTIDGTGASKATSGWDDTGVGKTENFTQQGIMNLSFNGTQGWGAVSHPDEDAGVPTKRECKWASARVLEYIDDYTIVVDDPTIFNLPDDTEYIIYVNGENPSRWTGTSTWGDTDGSTDYLGRSHKYRAGCTVSKRKGNAITFNQNMTYHEDRRRGYGGAISTRERLSSSYNLPGLFISPRKFWFVFQIFPIGEDDEPVPARSYSSICTVNKSGPDLDEENFGATFNESSFTDGPYSNTWLATPGDLSIIESSADYGFGKLDVEEGTSGNVQEFSPWKAGGWQNIDLSAIVEKDGVQPGDIVTTAILPYSSLELHRMHIRTNDYKTYGGDKGKLAGAPYMLAKYEDAVPVVSDFSVAPAEENPMFPEFTWSTDANDLWYGYMIIDDRQIDNKYHRSWHAGFDTPPNSSKNPFVNVYSSSSSWKEWYSEIGVASDSLDGTEPTLMPGLAGWAFDFNGSDDYVKTYYYNFDYVTADKNYEDSDNSYTTGIDWFDENGNISKPGLFYGLPTSNMSLIMHIIPNSSSIREGRDEYLFHSGGDDRAFTVWLDSNYNVNVEAYPDTSKYAPSALKSSTIVPNDGDTPTCIIVTFDNTLSHGNLKLFINGNLEDQSGKATVDGAIGKWKINTDLHVDTYSSAEDSRYFFAKHKSGGYSYYDGIMEEVSWFDITIYPLDPASGRYVFDKPISELSITEQAPSKSNNARLFIFDYHNIRGRTTNEIGMSPQVSFRKAAPLVDGRNV